MKQESSPVAGFVLPVDLTEARRLYLNEPHTPELITDFNRVFFGEISKVIEVDISVPKFTLPEDFIKAHKEESPTDMIVHFPHELMGEEKRYLLGKAYRIVGNSFVERKLESLKKKKISDSHFYSGYNFVESSIVAPNNDKNEHMLGMTFSRQRPSRYGLTLSEYLIAALYSKVIWGKYFDEGGSMSRLLSSKENVPFSANEMGISSLVVGFKKNGELGIYSYPDQKRIVASFMGGRSLARIV